MTYDLASRRKSGLSGAFTPIGKRQKAPRVLDAGPSIAAASLLFLALAEPAAANPRIGPTSSASVEISVSVAPSFKLASSASARQELKTATYCIATNGEQMALPVLLVQANSGEALDPSAGTANPLPWCNANGRPHDQAYAEDRMRRGLLLIRPE